MRRWRRAGAAVLVRLVLGTAGWGGGAGASTLTYTFQVKAEPSQLLVGGVVDLPLFVRELVSGTPGAEPFFGELPVFELNGLVDSGSAVVQDVLAAPGLAIDRTQRGTAGRDELFFFYDFSGGEVVPPGDNTPVTGVSEWRIGTLRVELGQPTWTVDSGRVSSSATLLDLSFGGTVGPPFGTMFYRPDPVGSPDGASSVLFTPTTQVIVGELGPGVNNIDVIADAEVVNFDRVAFRNWDVMGAVNGGELILDGLIDNRGTVEALAGSTVRLGDPNSGRFEQIDAGSPTRTFDDEITGGTFRVVNGVLDVAPDGFILADNAGTIELSGTSAMTNLFDDAASSPGRLSTGGRSLFNEGVLRLRDGVELSVSSLTNFGEATVEISGGAALTLQSVLPVSIGGQGRLVADGGTINGGLNISGDLTLDGDLTVTGDASFQVNSGVAVTWSSGGLAGALDVGGFLFVEELAGNEAVLDVSLGPGFLPEVGDEVVLADVGGDIFGRFARVRDNSADLDFETVADTAAGTLMLRAIAPIGLIGDYNSNGQVEQADLNLVLNSWGGTRTFS
ncbi:MAG: hypothetical protein AAGH92_01000, partial [Planctomycetota bacterium]